MIITERLVLEPFTEDNIDVLMEIEHDPSNSIYIYNSFFISFS